jgi:hypothetical protein
MLACYLTKELERRLSRIKITRSQLPLPIYAPGKNSSFSKFCPSHSAPAPNVNFSALISELPYDVSLV